MTKKVDVNTIEQFRGTLKPAADKIEEYYEGKWFKPESEEIDAALKIVNDYYKYLSESGIPYGNAAYDVANNRGSFGKFATKYFETEALEEGKIATQIPDLLNHLRVRLAFDDVVMRSNSPTKNGEISYEVIAQYHYYNLNMMGLSKKAWGGTFFEEFVGSGSWMDLGGYDTSVDVKQAELFKALATNRKVDGVSAWEYIGVLTKVGVKIPGVTSTALMDRTITGYDDTIKEFKGSIKEFKLSNLLYSEAFGSNNDDTHEEQPYYRTVEGPFQQEEQESSWFSFSGYDIPVFGSTYTADMLEKLKEMVWEPREAVISKGGSYKVKAGDTLWKLAQIHHTTRAGRIIKASV